MQDQSVRNLSKREILTLAIIFISALVVRLVYLYQFSASPFYDPQSLGLDPAAFHKMAVNVANGDWLGLDVYQIMPGYGYFLGIIYAILGPDFTAAYIVNCVLGAASVVLMYLLARSVSDKRAGIIAAIIGILSQSLVFYTPIIIGETLIIFLTVAFLLALLVAIDRSSLLLFLLSGILVGLNVLCRGTLTIFILLFIPWYAITRRKDLLRKALPNLAAMLLGAVLIVAPVTVRNYVVGGDFVLVTAHSGVSFYFGYNPKAQDDYNPVDELGYTRKAMMENSKRIAEEAQGRKLKPSQISAYWVDRAVDFIRSNPGRAIYLASRRILRFFNYHEVADVIDMKPAAEFSWLLKYCLIPFGFLAPFAMLGMGVAIRRRDFGPLYIFVAANLMTIMMTLPHSRYRLPVVPVLIVFAGVALVWIKDNFERKRRMLAAGVALLLCFVIVYLPLASSWKPATVAFRVGDVYFRSGKYDLAETELKKAVQLNPQLIRARLMLGHILEKSRKLDEAEEQYNAILKIEPENAKALAKMGVINYRRGDNQKALEYWNHSLEINPDQPVLHKILEKMKVDDQRGVHSPKQEQ